jgi:hypothetical protein
MLGESRDLEDWEAFDEDVDWDEGEGECACACGEGML